MIAERLLERIIGRMIDVNYHILTEHEGVPPKDFHESFTQLARVGVLPAELAHALAPAAGLRNRLAHEYNGAQGTATATGYPSPFPVPPSPAFRLTPSHHANRSATVFS